MECRASRKRYWSVQCDLWNYDNASPDAVADIKADGN
jgi:hypothetical protein